MNGPGWTDEQTASAYHCTIRTVANTRKRFIDHGFLGCINIFIGTRCPKRLLDGRQEAKIIALRLGDPPLGFQKWTLRLLALRVVALEIAPEISHERHAVRFKKNGMNTKKSLEYWVIPPEADAEFIASMEEVLDTYELPYNADGPVVCMDEQPVQLTKETRTPIAETAEHPKRVDDEYVRAGTAGIFMFNEPLAGWRSATAQPKRKKVDWAEQVALLLAGRYKDCSRITLVCDNLNTHTKGAFYELYPPEVARA